MEELEVVLPDLELKVIMKNYFSVLEHHYDGIYMSQNGTESKHRFIEDIIVDNKSEDTVPAVALRVSFNSDIFSCKDISLPPLEVGESRIDVPFINADYEKINELSSAVPCEIRFEIIDTHTGESICSDVQVVSVYPTPQLSNNDELLMTKLIIPSSSVVKQITQDAVLFNNGRPILGYQNMLSETKYDTQEMLKEIESIYLAIRKQNIIYQNPPASDQIFQRVRMASEIKHDHKATCLDSSILFCSCLEELGYNPLLILLPGHALVGVYLDKKGIDDDILFTGYELNPMYTKGNERVVFIETTCISADKDITFNEAMMAAKAKVQSSVSDTVVMNVLKCHLGPYSPVPISGNDEELSAAVEAKRISNRKLQKIRNDELSDVTSEYEMSRFKVWQRKLLDLKESNRLINLKMTFGNTVRVLADVNTVAQSEKVHLKKIEVPSNTKPELFKVTPEEIFNALNIGIDNEEQLSNQALCLTPEKSFRKIINENKTAVEETGAPTLYLCFGILECVDPKPSLTKKRSEIRKNPLAAPFILLPVEYGRETNGREFITFDVDNAKVNETFFEYLKLYLPNTDFRSLYDFSDLEKYYDACKSFKELCASMKLDIFLHEEITILTNLSFSHQVMYLDMVNRQEELKSNKIISSIINGGISYNEEIIGEEDKVESYENYKDFIAPLPYDSSQLKAIIDCGNGKSFVLDGPPGTGKSQTIVNMITNAFFNHKTVLFIAEKKTALDVVYKRMEDIKLDRYCLELHSNKANKASFFKKISEAIEFGSTKPVNDYEDLCEKLNKSRDEILEFINGMHVGKTYFYSLYDCIVYSKKHVKYSDSFVPFTKEFLEGMNREKLDHINTLIETYIINTEEIQNFDSSPLKYFGVQGINLFKDKDSVLNELKGMASEVGVFSNQIQKLFDSFPEKLDKNYENSKKLIDFYRMAYQEKLYLADVYSILTKKDEIDEQFAKLKDFMVYQQEIMESYTIDSLLKLDLKELANEFGQAKGLFKGKKQKQVIEKLQPYVTFEMNPANCGKVFYDMDLYQEKINTFKENAAILAQITGMSIDEVIAKHEECYQVYLKTVEALSYVESMSQSDGAALVKYFVNTSLYGSSDERLSYEYIVREFERYNNTHSLIFEKYKLNEYALAKSTDYFGTLEDIIAYAADPSVFEDLATLSNINKLRNGFIELGIEGLLDHVIASECLVDELDDLLVGSLAFNYLKLYLDMDSVSGFIPSELNKQISDYKLLIDQYRSYSVANVSALMSKDFAKPGVIYGNSSQIGSLKKICSGSHKGVSIRGVLLGYSDIILQYLPCFLMSPLSAAQYLAVDSENGKAFPKFDIVIFDEASQIPTHEAVGPIARGSSLIVAGDPKQMPPSPYSRQEIEDETMSVEDKTKYSDSESLLDECLAINLPRHRLTYHYRSKHESLIQFSNQSFYMNQLRTFPSSSTMSSKVEFNYIKTKDTKVDSKISKEELTAIAEKVKEIYTNKETKKMSLGVISFNLGQADKIEAEINRMFEANPEAKENFIQASQKDPLFVKNIENIQGDERDIIIMCVGFGLTKQGYAKLGGPLIAGDNNGERRLNVCASRAKERMILMSTLKSTQFREDSKIFNNGERCLKNFIRYCEEASFQKENGHKIGIDNIIYYVQNDLNKLGYETDTVVGSSEFAVDLAVRKPKSDKYQLGIIIDTSPVSDSITCRDKFYLHESVLAMMKWKVIYIYALEYYLKPKQTIEKIVKAISEAKALENHELEVTIEKQEETPYETLEYVIPKLNKIKYNEEYGFDEKIIEECEKVIDAISPVSYNTLKTIISEGCIKDVMSRPMEKNFKKLLEIHLVNTTERDLNSARDFYYKDLSKKMKKFYLAPSRDLMDISKYEIAACLNQILLMQPGINHEDLFRVALNALNCEQKSLIKTVKDRFEFVLKEMSIEENK